MHVSIPERFVNLKPQNCSNCGKIDDLFFTPSNQQCIVINLQGTSNYIVNATCDTFLLNCSKLFWLILFLKENLFASIHILFQDSMEFNSYFFINHKFYVEANYLCLNIPWEFSNVNAHKAFNKSKRSLPYVQKEQGTADMFKMIFVT